MGAWVLILITLYYGQIATTPVYFHTQEACIAARDKIVKERTDRLLTILGDCYKTDGINQ